MQLFSLFNWLWIILAVLVLLIIWVYNKLIRLKIRVDEAWADIETQLQRRYDLVPNLVETVKGYMQHEKEVFLKVTEARTRAMQSGSVSEKAQAENLFSETLKTLFAVAESYPELKANENFLELQRELVDTEDKVQAARRFYNSSVRDYNIAIAVFPQNLLAAIFGFTPRDLFEVQESEKREPVQVKF